MSTESFESPHEDPESVHADADRYLAHLQQHEHRESSSDLSEVLAVADRVVVMREGRIVGSLNGADATEETVMRLASISPKEPTDV